MQQGYEVKEIGQGIWAIEEGNVRMFLIEGNDCALLLDTGFGQGELQKLVSELTQKPIMLVLTHSDRDHIGGCTQFSGKVYMHPAEFERYAVNAPQSKLQPEPLWEGDEIDLGGRRLAVLHLPGHTPGSLLLLERETGILLSGDSVQEGPIFMFGSGRNLAALADSMERLEKWAGEIKMVLPCHGQLPVDASYIPEIRDGALAMLAGELEGKKPELPVPCQEYSYQRVKFYAP